MSLLRKPSLKLFSNGINGGAILPNHNTIYDDQHFQAHCLSKTSHELKNVFISIASVLKNLNLSSSLSIQEKEEFSFLSILCDYGLNLILDINTTDHIDYTAKKNSSSLTKSIFNSSTQQDEYNLVDALSFCVKMFQARKHFDNKSIDIILDNQIKRETNIKSIPSLRLRQVVINLLSNSYKFTCRGEIKLSCSYTSQGKVRIKVSDTGTGISDAYMKYLFEPYQVDSQNQKMNNQGSGLGLFIVKEILDAFNIGIECRSQLGKGTTFWFDVNVIEDGLFEIINPKMLISKDLMRMINDVNSGVCSTKDSTVDSCYYEDDGRGSNSNDDESNDIVNSTLSKNEHIFTQCNKIFTQFYSHTFNKMYCYNSKIFNSITNEKFNNNTIIQQTKDFKYLANLSVPEQFTRSTSNPNLFKKNNKKNFNPKTKKYNIFICDDERQIALSTKNLLMKYFKSKYDNEDSLPEIFIINDGIQCLYQVYQFYLDDNQCNLILIDQNMNFLNGDITCKIIKQIKQLENIAVYLITSDDISYFSTCGANGIFPKPISYSNIETILHNQFFD